MVARKKLFLPLTFLIFSTSLLFAQNNIEDSDKYSDNDTFAEESEEVLVEDQWQTLEWEQEDLDFVQKYEVVIEEYNQKKDSYTEINRIVTEDNTPSVKIQPQLQPGNYRYKIITYDLIGLPCVESDWELLSIYQAYKPQINGISSKNNGSSTLYLEDFNDGIFIINGRNLFDTRKSDFDIFFSSYVLKKSDSKGLSSIYPKILNTDEKNRKLEIQFDMKSLNIGVYDFIATDASGLKSEISNDSKITVKFRKPVDFDLSVGYLFPILFSNNNTDIINPISEYLESDIWPLSANVRMSFLPFKYRYGYFGIGLFGTYSYMQSKFPAYSITGNLITAHLDFVYQLPIRHNIRKSKKKRYVLTLELHGGVGTTFFNNFYFSFKNDVKSEPLNSMKFSFNFGAASQFYITNRLYAELCVDFVMALMGEDTDTKKVNFYTLYPSVSIGWQF